MQTMSFRNLLIFLISKILILLLTELYKKLMSFPNINMDVELYKKYLKRLEFG
jgi:hypothetical protein